MNDPLPPNPPELPNENPPISSPASTQSQATTARPHWVKRFLACNPFYLCSAALLLYGCYRVSIDSTFFKEETANLLFNFTSLQFYELLLVATAIFLAVRRIWYDSTLLVSLENLLVLVPFILISQAGLISIRMIWTMCVVAGAMALIRAGGLKRLIPILNFPLRFLLVGVAMLALNIALPVVYRLLHEHKFGTRLEAGPAYYTNEYVWLLVLPVVCALANLLLDAKPSGALLSQRRWVPPGFFSLWLLGTGVHLYCLGYVYDFALRHQLLAPAVWVLTWTLGRWTIRFNPDLSLAWQRGLLVMPYLATVLGISRSGDTVFLTLTTLNAIAYGWKFGKDREQPFALHLCLLSVAGLVGGLPETHMFGIEITRTKWVCAGAAGYFLLLAALSRHPGMGVFGALISAAVMLAIFGEVVQAPYWATEAALVFLLSHSLRCDDSRHKGARVFRIFVAVVWAAHAFVWIHAGGRSWMTWISIAPVVIAFVLGRLLSGRWGPVVAPLAAVLVAMAGPEHSAGVRVQALPVGLLAIIGSFALLGIGTIAALTKHRWYHQDSSL